MVDYGKPIPQIERILNDDESGIKQNCGECRYWSERVAQSIGCGPVEALCFSKASRHYMKYTTERMTCNQWAVNSLGAVDSVYWESIDKDPIKTYELFDAHEDQFEE